MDVTGQQDMLPPPGQLTPTPTRCVQKLCLLYSLHSLYKTGHRSHIIFTFLISSKTNLQNKLHAF
jgi:hypothetical protein